MKVIKLSFAPENGFDYESSGHVAFISATCPILTFINKDYFSHLHKLHVRPWIQGTCILTEIGIKQTDYDRAMIE